MREDSYNEVSRDHIVESAHHTHMKQEEVVRNKGAKKIAWKRTKEEFDHREVVSRVRVGGLGHSEAVAATSLFRISPGVLPSSD